MNSHAGNADIALSGTVHLSIGNSAKVADAVISVVIFDVQFWRHLQSADDEDVPRDAASDVLLSAFSAVVDDVAIGGTTVAFFVFASHACHDVVIVGVTAISAFVTVAVAVSSPNIATGDVSVFRCPAERVSDVIDAVDIRAARQQQLVASIGRCIFIRPASAAAAEFGCFVAVVVVRPGATSAAFLIILFDVPFVTAASAADAVVRPSLVYDGVTHDAASVFDDRVTGTVSATGFSYVVVAEFPGVNTAYDFVVAVRESLDGDLRDAAAAATATAAACLTSDVRR